MVRWQSLSYREAIRHLLDQPPTRPAMDLQVHHRRPPEAPLASSAYSFDNLRPVWSGARLRPSPGPVFSPEGIAPLESARVRRIAASNSHLSECPHIRWWIRVPCRQYAQSHGFLSTGSSRQPTKRPASESEFAYP